MFPFYSTVQNYFFSVSEDLNPDASKQTPFIPCSRLKQTFSIKNPFLSLSLISQTEACSDTTSV